VLYGIKSVNQLPHPLHIILNIFHQSFALLLRIIKVNNEDVVSAYETRLSELGKERVKEYSVEKIIPLYERIFQVLIEKRS